MTDKDTLSLSDSFCGTECRYPTDVVTHQGAAEREVRVGGPDSLWLFDRNPEPPALVAPILPTTVHSPTQMLPESCHFVDLFSDKHVFVAGSWGVEGHAFQCLLTTTGGLERDLPLTRLDHSSSGTHPQDREAPRPRVPAAPRRVPSCLCASFRYRQPLMVRHSPLLVHLPQKAE